MTEYMWDIVYWTWICLGATCVFGDRGWWLFLAVPVYSAYAGYKAVGGIREGFAGLGGGGQGQDQGAQPAGESKRQKKMEKRGGQKVQYR